MLDALLKLNPRKMMGNPVMFVVEIGSVITTVLLFQAAARRSRSICRSRCGCGSPCCSRTSPRPWRKAAARRRPTRCARRAPKPWPIACHDDGGIEQVPSSKLRAGDMVLVSAGRIHPVRRRDHRRRRIGGRVGDHRRIRSGDSRSRRRPLGGHRRHARALRPDQGQDHVEPRRDFPRSHDRAGRRRGAAEDAQRNRAEHSAGRA